MPTPRSWLRTTRSDPGAGCTPLERADCLRKAAAILRDNAEALAMLDAMNTGNPVAQMVADAKIAAAGIEYFAGLVTEIKGQTIPMGPGLFNYTLREPLGVVRADRRVQPPADVRRGEDRRAARRRQHDRHQGAASRRRCPRYQDGGTDRRRVPARGRQRAGRRARNADRRCRRIRWCARSRSIGSVPTGKAIMRAAADSLKPVLLELGGKNALIMYPDADLDKAVAGAVRGMNFTWAGQSCGSTSRLFVHESIHDRVLDRVVETIRKQHKPGMPTDWSTTMGCLISRAQLDKVLGFIEVGTGARARGSSPAASNRRTRRSPTVTSSSRRCSRTSRPTMRLAREEVFGPILSVFKWSDEETMFERGQWRRVRPHLLDLDARPRHRAPRGAARRGGLRLDQQRQRPLPRRAVRRLQAAPASGARRASRSSSSSRRRRT